MPESPEPSKKTPLDDPERPSALHASDLLDTPSEESFDRLVRLAARLLRAPFAQVNLIDDGRRFSRSTLAPAEWTTAREAALEDSFGKHTVLSGEPFVVEDGRSDPLVSGTPAVAEHGIVAYAGMPLITAEGQVLGTLCVCDTVARAWTATELDDLTDIRDSVTSEVELRRERNRATTAHAALAETQRAMSNLLDNMPGMAFRCRNEPTWPIEMVSRGVELLTGYSPEEFVRGSVSFADLVHPADRERVWQEVQDALARESPFHLEYRIFDRSGELRWVRGRGKAIFGETEENLRLEGFAEDITAQRKAELDGGRSAATLRAVLSSSPDVVELLGPDGRLLWVSPAVREVLGYSPESLTGRDMLEYVHTGDRDAVRLAMCGLEEREEEMRLRCRVQHRTGDWVVLDVRGRALEDDGPGKVVLVARDVTLEQELEQRLRRSEQQHRLLFEANPLPMWVCDPETLRYLDVNEAAVRHYGYSREEFLAMTLWDIRPPESVRQAERVVESDPESELVPVTRHATKGGRTIDVVVATDLVPFRGRPARLAVVHDVTEANRAAAALQLSEQRFRSLMENSLDIISVLEADGTIRYESPSIERVLGYSGEELVGRNVFELIHPEDQAPVQAAFETVLADPGVHTVELRFRHKDGSWRVLESNAQGRMQDPAVGGVVAHSRDITERVRLQDGLRAAKEEAERSNRAKSEFLSRMSHELRTPMNAILGFAQILELDLEGREDQESVQQILRAGRHLLGLINEVLDIARVESGQMTISAEPVHLREVLEETLALVRPLAAERRVRLPAQIPQLAEVYVLADRQRLKQVLLNLLSNAIKYNRENGLISLICAPASGERLRIGVRDTGRGISPERLARLFTPFDRLGAERAGVEGSGLGLALSKALVEALGGTMEVESVPGDGSTFWVEFPLAEDQISQLERDFAPPPSPLPSPERVARTVLHIEDNLANQRLVERVLAQRPGIQLIPSMQGRLGLELAEVHRPDLILLDLHLPDMAGEDVLQRLRASDRTAGIPVVVISADAMPRQVERLREAGAREFITKPIQVASFLEVLDAILSGEEAGR